MALNKFKLGSLIELVTDNKNSLNRFGIESVRGVNNKKKMINTKADLTNRDLSKFQVVNPGEFVFNHRTSRNGDKFSITYNYTENPLIFTEDYVVFKVKESCKDILNNIYLYMYFNRNELDRYVITNSWGSSTEFFNWADICNIELELPSIEIQKKYVDIYETMLKNLSCYENGLDDLRNVCDVYYDKIKNNNLVLLKKLITNNNKRNSNNEIDIKFLKGISDKNKFADTTANTKNIDLSKYLIVEPNEFVVNFMCLGNFGKFYLAYNDLKDSLLLSPACTIFKINDDKILNPYYLKMLLSRTEFQRKCVVLGDCNTRGGINFDDFTNISIPLIPIEQQKIIANLYLVLENRKDIYERVNNNILDICPILIKGSLDEALDC